MNSYSEETIIKNPYSGKKGCNAQKEAWDDGFRAGDKNGYHRAIDWSLERDTILLEKVYKIQEQKLKEEHLAGEKKVVEWIKTNVPEGYDQWGDKQPLYLLYIDKELWKAFLKAEGIE